MREATEQLRAVLGLKLRAARAARGWTLQELAARTGVAVSYLSEIEKGKKHPKPEKLLALARALETPYPELVSGEVERELSPLEAFAGSDLVREFPFRLFGVEPADLIELVAHEPRRAGALLRTFGEVAHRHDLEVEQLLFAALRAYQQAERNHFPELELAAERCREESGWSVDRRLAEGDVRDVLERRFGCRVDLERLAREPELADVRAIRSAGPPPRVHVNRRLAPRQRAFVLAREVGRYVLGLDRGPAAAAWLEPENFDQVLGNFRAAYFAGALLVPRAPLGAELRAFLGAGRCRPRALERMLARFGVTPETLFHRVSQIAAVELGVEELFFARFQRGPGAARPRLTRLLNLARVELPYGVTPDEHYCRRWPGLSILGRSRRPPLPIAPAAAVCRFQSEPVEFLVLAMARELSLQPGTLSSVSLGLRIDDRLRGVAGFLDDEALPRREVDLTCERCPLAPGDCRDRAAAPVTLERRARRARRAAALAALVGDRGITVG